MKRRFLRPKNSASSLITTLLVIVVLATIVVAFMQSMSVERLTAKSMANQYRAALVSDAAVQAALRSLQDTITGTNGPQSTIFSTAAGSAAPYLFQAKYRVSGTAVSLIRSPQFSTLQDTAAFTNASATLIPTNTYTAADLERGAPVTRSVSRSADIQVDMNLASKAFPYGQIGLISAGAAIPTPVNWIYFRDNDGAIIGRYAYWIDDESSKIDLRFAGNTLGAANGHFRGNGTNVNEVSLHVLTNAGLNPALLTNLFAFKAASSNRFNIAESRYGSAAISDTNWALIRPHLTMFSLQDDRAPDGRRKLNLNEIVTDTTDPAEITQQVNTIRDAILANLPEFGTRYYKQNAGANTNVSDIHQTNYVTKIAANIRDFIDTDRNATVVLSDGQASVNNARDFLPYGDDFENDVIPVFGKENVPLLNEYLRAVRIVSPVPDTTSPNGALRNVTLRMAHYVELWNLTSEDITASQLGPNPFISITKRTKWDNYSTTVGAQPTILRPMDIRIYLPSNFTVPAGGYAVIATSDGSNEVAPTNAVPRLPGDTAGLDAPQPGTWQAVDGEGENFPVGDFEDYIISTSRDSSGYFLRAFGSTSGSYVDCEERIMFANDRGLLDYTPAIYTVHNTRMSHKPEENPKYLSTFIADNSLKTIANTPVANQDRPRYTRGDPRSNTESIAVKFGTSAVWKNGETSVGDTGNTQDTLGADNTGLILAPNANNLWHQGWGEYTADLARNQYGANTNLFSLGQLGYIYDPSRFDSAGYRSVSRTLRIGQSDDPSNNRNGNSSSANDQNWLGGVGSTNMASTNSRVNAGRLLEVFRTDDVTAGRINPNAMSRGSNNMAFRALLEGFVFSSSAHEASALSAVTLNVTNVMTLLSTNAATPRQFVGVGEVGNLPVFHADTNFTGINMANVSDAGKEEFFRRTANLMATESLAFTIISKAQAGLFRRDGAGADRFVPTSTVTRETTVQLVPSYPSGDVRPLPDSWQVKIVRDIFY